MCKTYTWAHDCGCLALKPAYAPITRCPSSKTCKLTNHIMHLSFPCSPDCNGVIEQESHPDESQFFHGKFQGMTTAEDRFFGRSRSPDGSKGDITPPRRLRVDTRDKGLVLGEGFEIKNGDEMTRFGGKLVLRRKV